MNLHQLKYFYDAARLGSVTESAKANFVTQSAVSQAIRALEATLDVKLIHHRKNAFGLTDEGRVTFHECSVIFAAIENLKAHVSRSKTVLTGRLKLASTNSIALSVLAPVLTSLSKRHPQLSIQMKMGNSEQVKEYLQTGEAELGFILEDDEMEGLESTLIKEGEFLLVANGKRKAALNEVIITRQTKAETAFLKRKLGNTVNFKMEVFSWELIRNLCIDGAGVGYLPDYLVQDDLKRSRLRVIKPEMKLWKYKLVAVWMKGRVLNSASAAFLNELAKSGK